MVRERLLCPGLLLPIALERKPAQKSSQGAFSEREVSRFVAPGSSLLEDGFKRLD